MSSVFTNRSFGGEASGFNGVIPYVPAGCRFHPRCAMAQPVCSQKVPTLVSGGGSHPVACLMYEPGSGHSAAEKNAA